jgi:hypothetical protein
LTVKVFYIDGCPNHQTTVERVNELLEEMALTADVVQVRVADSASAVASRFLGSPTVHVDGIDVEPSSRADSQFGIMCRTYLDGGKRQGFPPKELIRQALLESLIPSPLFTFRSQFRCDPRKAF